MTTGTLPNRAFWAAAELAVGLGTAAVIGYLALSGALQSRRTTTQ